jgi:hypothetical protein
MVSDSNVSDGDRSWCDKKVFRHKGALLGFAGPVDYRIKFLKWWKSDRAAPPPIVADGSVLILDKKSLFTYSYGVTGELIASGIEAVGSGAKAAMCAYDALGHTNPAKAVRIVCKHDSGSCGPVRTYKLQRDSHEPA